MKRNLFYTFFLLAGVVLVGTACNSNTYARLRAQEDKIIANYLSRNNLQIHTTLPGDDQWGERDYYKVPGYDNLYFHLISRGDSVWMNPDSIEEDMTVMPNEEIIMRYKKYELTEGADTISYWTTLDEPYPYEFHYLNLTDCEAQGWHEAVRLMKYPNSQCIMIVPSKQGFTADQMSVTPYGYIMKFKTK